jgi:hypothetical protein
MNRPLLDVLHRLRDLGHAPEFPAPELPFMQWLVETGGKELLRRYQRFHRLPETGTVDGTTLAELERPRCGVPDVMAFTGVSCWGPRVLSYTQAIEFPGVDAAEVAQEYAEACRRIEAVCGLSLAPAPPGSAAQIRARSAPIDGPWNTLALSELPPPDAPSTTCLNQTFDVAEAALSPDQRVTMFCHEICHCLGLSHAPVGSGALMEPMLARTGYPQPWDIQQLQARYGPPIADASPAPMPMPPPIPGPSPIPCGTVTTGAGPPVTSVVIDCPGPGTYGLNLTFDRRGAYVLLIVEPAAGAGSDPPPARGNLT